MSQTVIDRAARLHRDVTRGVRLYQLTPPGLRKPEPAMRAAVTASILWFGALFLALGTVTTQTAPTANPLRYGYYVAVAFGTIGLALASNRQLRPAMACLGGMLLVGQATTLAVVV